MITINSYCKPYYLKLLCSKISGALCLAFMLFAGLSATAQEDIQYSVKFDTNVIVIGDQVNMELFVKQPLGIRIDLPSFKDSIASKVEILQQTGPDTIPQKDGRILVKKNLLITSFDGGVHKIAPLEFTVHQQNFVNVIRTDTLALGVNTFEIDTTKGNFDIMMPYGAPLSFIEIAPWILGGLLLVGIIALLILYWYKRKKNQPLFRIFEKPKEPPHVIALRKLDGLKNEKLWQTGRIKEYHTQLTDILRIYLEDRFDISTLERTSEEILETTADLSDVDKEQQSNLREILTLADLVKFAKFQPLSDENDRSLINAYLLVNNTKKEEVAEPKEENVEKESETIYKTLK